MDLDSRGFPTAEAEVVLKKWRMGESCQLFGACQPPAPTKPSRNQGDGDKAQWLESVRPSGRAEYPRSNIAPALEDFFALDQVATDQALITLTARPIRAARGANAS